MYNKTKITMISCFGLFGVLALLIFFYSRNAETFPLIGLMGLLLAVCYTVIGLILCIPVSTRVVGKAVLISGGIILLIGLSVCSFSKFKLN